MPTFSRSLLNTLAEKITHRRHLIQIITGPRQVGKTTLIKQLLAKNLIFSCYYSSDGLLADANWLNMIWEEARVKMKENGETSGLLVIDDIQKIPNWSEAVKKNWDRDTKNNLELQLIIIGSSRSLLQKNVSKALLKRCEINQLGHWSYLEMHQAFCFTPEQFVWCGGYPGVAEIMNDTERVKNYLQTVISNTLSQDILALTRVNKPALLSKLFEFATTYNSQIVSYTKILDQLAEPGNTNTLVDYLHLLDQAGLVGGLDTYNRKLIRTRSSSPKFVVHSSALITAGNTKDFTATQADPVYWGRLVESAIGAHLLASTSKNPAVKLSYWREDNAEVDFVLSSGRQIIGIEVESKATENPTRSLAKFTAKFPQAKTITIGETGLSWQEFLTKDLTEILSY